MVCRTDGPHSAAAQHVCFLWCYVPSPARCPQSPPLLFPFLSLARHRARDARIRGEGGRAAALRCAPRRAAPLQDRLTGPSPPPSAGSMMTRTAVPKISCVSASPGPPPPPSPHARARDTPGAACSAAAVPRRAMLRDCLGR
eukprot:360958-Chlamydomonas_euryale.AAC.5